MRKKEKAEFIPQHVKKECYFCKGEGCKRCKYTGVFVQTYYHIIYKNMCFGIDTPK